eukprot:scaffold1183_cov114-Cylindrotheca_fusiformis.AAC.3
MAKLITDHDPYHIHKILGVLTLLHYLYRFVLLFQYGTAFPQSEPKSHAVAGVVLHGLLSWSSLLLPLPAKRNFNKPMIWPEFRLHSITFASRHVVTTLITLLDLWPNNTNSTVPEALARAVVVLGTVQAAKIISNKYGDREKRTTNAMPYPSSVSSAQQASIKKQYALSQFSATTICMINDPSMTFAPLLGIQMAPLMMTLVRKGKATSFDYHRIYAFSLYLGYAMVFVRLFCGETTSMGLKVLFMLNFPMSKLRRISSAMVVGIANVLVAFWLYPQEWMDTHISDQMAIYSFWFVTIAATMKSIYVYAPLFGVSFPVYKKATSTPTVETKKAC